MLNKSVLILYECEDISSVKTLKLALVSCKSQGHTRGGGGPGGTPSYGLYRYVKVKNDHRS